MSFFKHSLILFREKLSFRFLGCAGEVYLPIDISQQDKVLICLPEKDGRPFSIKNLVQDYQSLFEGCFIQYFSPAEPESDISPAGLLQYNKDTFPLTHHLSRPFKQRLQSNYYKIAIDLNIDFSLPAAIICKSSGAPIRISFNKPNAHFFYNILIQVNDKDSKDPVFIEKLFLLKNHVETILNIRDSKIN